MRAIRSTLWRCRTTFSVSGQSSFFTIRAAVSLRSKEGVPAMRSDRACLVGLDADLHVIEAGGPAAPRRDVSDSPSPLVMRFV